MSQLQSGELGGMAGRRQREEELARAEQFYGAEGSHHRLSEGGYEPADESCCEVNVNDMERIISVAAGAGLATVGLLRGRLSGLALTSLGAGLVWRGYSGRCLCYAALGINTAKHNQATAVPAKQGEKVEKTITISRRPQEIYQFWRRLENLPRVMNHLERVKPIDSLRSHWIAKGPLGTRVEWEAEIINERQDELIAWRSLPGGDIQTAGSIHFKPSAREGDTDVTLSMKYNPPAGKVGAQIADWMGDGLEQKLDEDLCRLKEEMESGTAAGSTANAQSFAAPSTPTPT